MMDMFELIKEHYGRMSLTAPRRATPPPELPSLTGAIEMLIDEVDRLHIIAREHKVLFQKEVIDIMEGDRELDKLKTTHWVGLRNDPYHNSNCIRTWGYTSNCPTCRVIKYAEEARDELTKLQNEHTLATHHELNWKELRKYLRESAKCAQMALDVCHTMPNLSDWVTVFIAQTASILESGEPPQDAEETSDE